MSNLIKLKQIAGGVTLQNNVAKNLQDIEALKTAVGNESVADQIAAIETTHYEIEKTADHANVDAAIAAAVGEAELHDGDTCVVKELIASGKYSYTAYIYESEAWKAMDGNYNASNVYFADDITVTIPVGTVTQTMINNGNGAATLSAEGKSLDQVLMGLLAEEKEPSVDNPSATFSTSGGSGEVGSTYTYPTATVKITDIGSYTYGSKSADGSKSYGSTATGISFKAGDVTISEGDDNSKSNESDMTTNSTLSLQATGTSNLYTDSSVTYTFTASAKYTQTDSDRYPVTNIGNISTKKSPIASDTTGTAALDKTSVTATFTGWRKMFMGTLADTTTELTSSVIRGLSLVSKQASKTAQEFTVPVGAKRIVVAFPKSYTTAEPKFEYFTMSWEDFAGFTKVTDVSVADYRGGENGKTDYIVYVFTHASASGFEADTKYRVTLK